MRPRRLRATRRSWFVWRRDLAVYRKTWKVNFLPPLVEPLLYVFAFGAGLAGLVGRLPWEGRTVSYLEFIAPALVAVTIMNSAFFETTYASFVRMYYQKTFDAMLATPLSLEDIITGEILWGATRSVLATALVMAALLPFGLIRYPEGLLLLPLALLGGLAFASAGMVFTGLLPNIETFNLPVFLFITPMFLVSGTFFSLSGLPGWARVAAGCLPLTHLTAAARTFGLAGPPAGLLPALLYLAVFGAVLYPVALRVMRRRLIK
jgi:lipooligosaccharide transport system permease protein